MRRSRALQAVTATQMVLLLFANGCSTPPPRLVRATWVAGTVAPEFDPHGPSDPLRESLERALARGLTDLDADDRVQPALAERWVWSADRCTLRFELRPDLRFADGSPVLADHIREALLAGLARTDHRRSAHLLAAVRGVGSRSRRDATPVGIEARDARTLVLTLTRPDPMLPAKLALPGMSAPWRQDSAGWAGASGCGPYRVLRAEGERALWLVKHASASGAMASVDTLEVRFESAAARVRSRMREGAADVVWPLPPPLLTADPPPGYERVQWAARPERRLVLVLRQDRPPFSRPDRRLTLLRAADVRGLAEMLGPAAGPVGEWLPGGGATAPLGPAALRRESAAGLSEVPRSFHFRLGFDADGPAARIASRLEERFGGIGLYVELAPLRGERRARQMRAGDGPEALLVECRAFFPGAAEALAPYVESPSGVPLAGFRTGWRPRDLAAALGDPGPLDPVRARERMEEERSLLPIARLDWTRAQRTGAVGVRSHPRFGLEYTDLRQVVGADIGH